MSAEEYLMANRQELLRIFSEIHSGKSMILSINPKIDPFLLDRECCLDAVIVHFFHNGEVDFPIKYPAHELSEFQENLALELHAIVLCEDGVKNGDLVRDGLKYAPARKNKHINKKYGKYVITK